MPAGKHWVGSLLGAGSGWTSVPFGTMPVGASPLFDVSRILLHGYLEALVGFAPVRPVGAFRKLFPGKFPSPIVCR